MRDALVCLAFIAIVVLPAGIAMRASRQRGLDTDPDFSPDDIK